VTQPREPGWLFSPAPWHPPCSAPGLAFSFLRLVRGDGASFRPLAICPQPRSGPSSTDALPPQERSTRDLLSRCRPAGGRCAAGLGGLVRANSRADADGDGAPPNRWVLSTNTFMDLPAGRGLRVENPRPASLAEHRAYLPDLLDQTCAASASCRRVRRTWEPPQLNRRSASPAAAIPLRAPGSRWADAQDLGVFSHPAWAHWLRSHR